MGGDFVSDSMHVSTSYLVTNTVLSEKYAVIVAVVSVQNKVHFPIQLYLFTHAQKAATNNIKIMKPNWIKKLWNNCQLCDVDVESSEYDAFIVRPFFNLAFTSTSLSITIKEEMKRLIENNDGTYIGAFQAAKVNFLLMDENGMTSAKYKAALQTKKECVKPAWIRDSVEAGYALPLDEYKIDALPKVNPSTPRKTSNELAFNPDWTNVSEIVSNSTVNETMCSTASSNLNVGGEYFYVLFRFSAI